MSPKRFRKFRIAAFDLPIEIQKGEHGLFYIGSPLVRGLFVTGQTEEAALAKVDGALRELAKAALAGVPV